MKNEEKLLLAIGEISDDIIAEASSPYQINRIPFKRAAAIAASVAVVTIGVTLLSGIFAKKFDANLSGGSAPNMNGAMEGDCSEPRIGSLVYMGKSGDNSFNFILTLDTTGSVNILLKSTDGNIFYTTDEATPNGVEIRRPTITVNGELSDSLPSLPGEYDITISFDEMEDNVEWNKYITIDPFGRYFIFD